MPFISLYDLQKKNHYFRHVVIFGIVMNNKLHICINNIYLKTFTIILTTLGRGFFIIEGRLDVFARMEYIQRKPSVRHLVVIIAPKRLY